MIMATTSYARSSWWTTTSRRLGTEQYHGKGAMDFGRNEVREYTFRLIEEAVRRYDCERHRAGLQSLSGLLQRRHNCGAHGEDELAGPARP